MDILSKLTPAKGSRKKKKRIGRGTGSGHGKTATRGQDGAKSRSGHKFKYYFEGGQMPLSRRVPKFGFRPRNRVEYQVINVAALEKLVEKKKITDAKVSPESLYQLGVISKKNALLKVLGDGNIKIKLEVSAHAFSKSAIEKIQAAGGTVTRLS